MSCLTVTDVLCVAVEFGLACGRREPVVLLASWLSLGLGVGARVLA
jgi:hypothetical protein